MQINSIMFWLVVKIFHLLRNRIASFRIFQPARTTRLLQIVWWALILWRTLHRISRIIITQLKRTRHLYVYQFRAACMLLLPSTTAFLLSYSRQGSLVTIRMGFQRTLQTIWVSFRMLLLVISLQVQSFGLIRRTDISFRQSLPTIFPHRLICIRIL